MKIQSLTPMLRTWDLPASIRFYTTLLGFVCEASSESWALLKWHDAQLMLSTPNSHTGEREPAFTGSLYFRTDAVDELWNSVKDRVNICYGIETFYYGMREFGIYDNNGYLLQIGQAVSKR